MAQIPSKLKRQVMTINRTQTRTVTVAFLTFIGIGMSAGLLGLAWPSIQKQFELPLDAVSILYLFSTISYTLSSFLIGRLMARFGSGTTLLAGAVVMSLCLFGVATSSTWALIIAFSTLSGLGNGVIDAGLNMYMATYQSARQMSWLHACFGIGITIGPLIMTFVLAQKLGWQAGYATVALMIMIIVALFAVTHRLWRNEGFQTAENQTVQRASFAETLRVPVVWLSMATYFIYVGMEIGIGQWAYTLLTQSRGISPEYAGPWVSIYWGSFTVGRFLFGIIANRFRIERILRYCMLAMIVGAVLFWWNPINVVGLIGLVIVGAGQAPIFPMLMSDTAQRVGAEHAENGISLQMGAVGISTAFLPGLIGTIGKNYGLETMAGVFVVMAILVFACHELTIVNRAKQPTLAVVQE
jgi:fucose permease